MLSDEATNSPCRLVHAASPLVLRMLVRPEQLFGDAGMSHALDAALVKDGIANIHGVSVSVPLSISVSAAWLVG